MLSDFLPLHINMDCVYMYMTLYMYMYRCMDMVSGVHTVHACTLDSVNSPECVHVLHAAMHVCEPLGWVGRVPRGQKTFAFF